MKPLAAARRYKRKVKLLTAQRRRLLRELRVAKSIAAIAIHSPHIHHTQPKK